MNINKIYYSTLTVIFSAMMMAACDEDDSTSFDGISIQEGVQTSMVATGAESVLNCSKQVSSAYSTQDWLNVSVSGNSVIYSATANLSRESRHAAVIIKAAPEDSTIVNISQEGLILTYTGSRMVVPSNDEAHICTQFVSNEVPLVNIISQPDWCKSIIKDDSIHADLDKNDTGHPRMGHIVFGVGDALDSVKVIQYETSQLKSSKWIVLGASVYDGSLSGGYATLTFWGKTAYLTLKTPLGEGSSDWRITLSLDPSTMTFSFNNGQFIGKDLNGNDVALILISSGYNLTLDTTPVGKFELDIDEDGLVSAYLGGVFPSEVGDLSIIGMMYVCFSKRELSAEARLDDLGGLAPCMIALPNEDAASAQRLYAPLARIR